MDWITSLVNSEKSLSGWKLQGGAGLPRYCFPFLGFPKGSKSRPGPAPPHIRGLIFHSYTAHIFITNSIYENLKLMRPFPGIFPCLKSGGGHFLHLLLPFSFFSLINWRCWQYNWKLDPSQLSVKKSTKSHSSCSTWWSSSLPSASSSAMSFHDDDHHHDDHFHMIMMMIMIIISTLFLMSINHISRPHKCPLPTDGPTLEMTAHCITIWSKFSHISI